MEDCDLEAAILAHVGKPDYRPVKARVIADQLQGPLRDRRDVKKVIKDLVNHGRLQYGANRLVKPAGSAGAALSGVFRRTAAGFGFVRPAQAVQAGDTRQDIYIPAQKTLDAASGDLVRVRLRRRGGGPRPRQEGEIVEILERDSRQFVGVCLERGGVCSVQVDGKLFARPIPVGDPGAKGAAAGDKVVIEMVRFPSHISQGEAVIVELLGPRGAPGVDTLTVLREFHLPEGFPEDVREAARRQAERFDGEIPRNRLDLTDMTAATIDPKDARDFDDAISVERLDGGGWRLGVHIADVAHFVRRNSPLDHEARRRGTSVYLPDRVIPMLPEVISNDLASLQPNRVRYAKTAFLQFAPDGERTAIEIRRTAIRSSRRFSYEEVDEFLAHPQSRKKKLTPEVASLLECAHELAKILRGRRLQRGAIELTMPEIRVELDRAGRIQGAHLEQQTESHRIIEEFMLAANEAVAETLRQQGAPFLRRIHEDPDPKKLRELSQFVRELGIACGDLGDRFEIRRILAKAAGRPEEHALNYAVLRSMQKAVYSPKEEGHYALNSSAYCHFTSPIRRYPDLTIHRMLDHWLRRRRPVVDLAQQVSLGEHCSQCEQRAEAAERELVKIKLLSYLSERVGRTMEAVVTGVEEYGLFAQGLELPAEGLIHVNSLQDDYYRYDAATRSLTGARHAVKYRLGDVLEVEIAHVDVDRRELDFRVVKRVASRSRPSHRGRGKSLSPKRGRKRTPGARKRKPGRGKRRR